MVSTVSILFGGIYILEDKHLFDVEYNTQNRKEVEYLKSLSIRYSFVKRVSGISVYKYTKSAKLFEALRLFYAMKEDLKGEI